MKKLPFLCLAISLFYFGLAHSKNHIDVVFTEQVSSNDIIATITKNTTEDQLNELVSYFEENDITLNLNKVEYNEKNEIVSIKISLEKDGQKSNYGLSSNQPISNIELGYRDQQLFIDADSVVDQLNSFADLMHHFSNENNSISDLLSSDFLSFGFDSEEFQNFMNNDIQSFDFNALRDKFLDEAQDGNNDNSNEKSTSNFPKYNFINTPGLNKLIIIDGKESDFYTLDQLAKNNKLEDVDNLKASTAESLYGKKAKDGAIIATTKN